MLGSLKLLSIFSCFIRTVITLNIRTHRLLNPAGTQRWSNVNSMLIQLRLNVLMLNRRCFNTDCLLGKTLSLNIEQDHLTTWWWVNRSIWVYTVWSAPAPQTYPNICPNIWGKYSNNSLMFSTLYGPRQAETCLRACAKCTYSDSSHACAMTHSCICSQLVHSIVSDDFVSGQRRLWSDCTDAQADLGLRCPYVTEDTFSHVAIYINIRCTYLYNSNLKFNLSGGWVLACKCKRVISH